jgi:hypothetical protein
MSRCGGPPDYEKASKQHATDGKDIRRATDTDLFASQRKLGEDPAGFAERAGRWWVNGRFGARYPTTVAGRTRTVRRQSHIDPHQTVGFHRSGRSRRHLAQVIV